jgi:hypothetical protein
VRVGLQAARSPARRRVTDEAAVPQDAATFLTDDGLRGHCRRIVREMAAGLVVPFLGAGVNRPGRPPNEAFSEAAIGRFLPDGGELAAYVAEQTEYPRSKPDETLNLQRVSQYCRVTDGWGRLYRTLGHVFNAQYDGGAVHALLARIAAVPSNLDGSRLLVVTTNYDDALERAYEDFRPRFEYDTVWYMAEGADEGKFVHRAPGKAQGRVIKVPNRYTGLNLAARPVILKMHGAVDRGVKRGDDGQNSYVITEDHYIDYLRRTALDQLVPAVLMDKLRNSRFLFLGYGLNDWNFRVILNRIHEDQYQKERSWAVEMRVDPVEAAFWQQREVDTLHVDLERFVDAVSAALGSSVPAD